MKKVQPESFNTVKKLYSFYDAVGEEHNGPYVFDSDVSAVRAFVASISKSPFPRSNYKLCILGMVNLRTGDISPCEPTEIEIPSQFEKVMSPSQGTDDCERPVPVEK